MLKNRLKVTYLKHLVTLLKQMKWLTSVSISPSKIFNQQITEKFENKFHSVFFIKQNYREFEHDAKQDVHFGFFK